MAHLNLTCDPTAAHRLLKQDVLREVETDLISARNELLDDVAGIAPMGERGLGMQTGKHGLVIASGSVRVLRVG